jgi:ATP-dependent exoDNAse (exonuclease V) alpha subunit
VHNSKDEITLPKQIVTSKININDIFPKNFSLNDIDDISQRIILTPTNVSSLKANDEILKRLKGEEKIYQSTDWILSDKEEEKSNNPLEVINAITPTGMPPHSLHLKPGAIVMLLRNLHIGSGLCNGSRIVIVSTESNRYLHGRLLVGPKKGEHIFIPRINLTSAPGNYPVTIQRKQFPVRLAFSMTINKSQGQTFQTVGVLLESQVFTHGQLYVAFSRCRNFDSLRVFSKTMENKEGIARNVVYKEVLGID